MQQWIDYVQWFAFAASVTAAWLVASPNTGRRKAGFWVFMFSNLLWIAWGLHAGAMALIALQVCLALMNVRGLSSNQAK